MRILKTFYSSTFILLSALLVINCTGSTEDTDNIKFYVGSSDGSLEYSIFLCELDLRSSQFVVIDSFAGARGPSYLAFSPDRKYLYAINNEVSDPATNHKTVSSFKVDQDNNKLELMNSQSSEGAGPCHVHCSKEGTFLFTANYTSGNVVAFPISENGMIQQASSAVQSTGSGPVESRQKGPHTHYVSLDPEENYLLSPDLGSDKVLVYKFDHDSGILTPNPEQNFFKLKPGSGPRHLAFHPTGKFVYVVNELNSTLTACSYDMDNGILTALNTESTEADSYTGSKYPAAVRMHPNGKYVYASTRGDFSSIAVFRVENDGAATRIQVVKDVPEWPRDFNIEPDGSFLLVAGQRSDEIQLYRIDRKTGLLTSTEHTINVPAPACILFID
ncbi:MAG: lactonase family protein [Bacteroidales bacterium]|nr:lactonase family protein [Bacteroidales bacterium]